MNSKHNNDLIKNVNPKDLPLQKKAPCWAGGDVNTVDDDSKEAECECEYMTCLVDCFNNIIFPIRKDDRLLPKNRPH
jgi:hypothetical protein